MGLGAVALPTDAARSTAAAAARSRPNVLIFETDDQTAAEISVLPSVRHLIGDAGVTFDRSFVSFSLCCPSRATLLTGQYAHNHGVRGNNPPDGGYYRLDSTSTLAVWLQRAGYYTVHLGKYLNGYGTRDPYELQSLHTDPRYPSLRAALAERLHVLVRCAGATCRGAPNVSLAVRCVRGALEARVTGKT